MGSRPFERATPAKVNSYGVVDDVNEVKHSSTVNVLPVWVTGSVAPSSADIVPVTLLTCWRPRHVVPSGLVMVESAPQNCASNLHA